MTNRSNQNWPNGEVIEVTSKAQKIADYIKGHGLPAVVTDKGILTEDRYSRNGIGYSEPITIPADFQQVRDWLGY